MNYGMYMSASGALTAMRRLEVQSNNLANVSTSAFKPDFAYEVQRQPVRIEDDLPFLPSNELLERLGGGVLSAPSRIDLEPGPLQQTGRSLDLALEMEGFFVVGPGGEDTSTQRLTRDGRLSIGAGGSLVRSVDGQPLLNAAGAPVRVDPTLDIAIDGDGTVRQEGDVVGRLSIVRPADHNAIVKEGSGLYRLRDGAPPPDEVFAGVRQGFLERSGVDPMRALMAITQAGSAVDRNSRMIAIHDQNLSRAINTLGRVS